MFAQYSIWSNKRSGITYYFKGGMFTSSFSGWNLFLNYNSFGTITKCLKIFKSLMILSLSTNTALVFMRCSKKLTTGWKCNLLVLSQIIMVLFWARLLEVKKTWQGTQMDCCVRTRPSICSISMMIKQILKKTRFKWVLKFTYLRSIT